MIFATPHTHCACKTPPASSRKGPLFGTPSSKLVHPFWDMVAKTRARPGTPPGIVFPYPKGAVWGAPFREGILQVGAPSPLKRSPKKVTKNDLKTLLSRNSSPDPPDPPDLPDPVRGLLLGTSRPHAPGVRMTLHRFCAIWGSSADPPDPPDPADRSTRPPHCSLRSHTNSPK